MLDPEKLTELEELGGVFFTLEEAAVILQVDADKLKEVVGNHSTPEHQSYHRGRLKAEFETRKAIVKQAKDGSNPAQVLAMSLIKKMKMSDA